MIFGFFSRKSRTVEGAQTPAVGKKPMLPEPQVSKSLNAPKEWHETNAEKLNEAPEESALPKNSKSETEARIKQAWADVQELSDRIAYEEPGSTKEEDEARLLESLEVLGKARCYGLLDALGKFIRSKNPECDRFAIRTIEFLAENDLDRYANTIIFLLGGGTLIPESRSARSAVKEACEPALLGAIAVLDMNDKRTTAPTESLVNIAMGKDMPESVVIAALEKLFAEGWKYGGFGSSSDEIEKTPSSSWPEIGELNRQYAAAKFAAYFMRNKNGLTPSMSEVCLNGFTRSIEYISSGEKWELGKRRVDAINALIDTMLPDKALEEGILALERCGAYYEISQRINWLWGAETPDAMKKACEAALTRHHKCLRKERAGFEDFSKYLGGVIHDRGFSDDFRIMASKDFILEVGKTPHGEKVLAAMKEEIERGLRGKTGHSAEKGDET